LINPANGGGFGFKDKNGIAQGVENRTIVGFRRQRALVGRHIEDFPVCRVGLLFTQNRMLLLLAGFDTFALDERP
jgi:hypothetical protein